jgi:hypothetical protein
LLRRRIKVSIMPAKLLDRLPLLSRLIRLRRPSPPDPWQLGVDAREVMLARITRWMTGTLTAAEARRMILEKASAGIRSHLAYGQALFDGNAASASRAFLEVYRREVRANRKRLRRRWWRR